MFLELIATFAAGAGAAGIVLILNMLTKGRLPRWAMPVAAGLAMIGVAISSEVSWGARTTEGLPEGVVVVDEVKETAWYRPWSFLAPPTTRLVALDTGSLQTNPDEPGIVLADLYLFARWRPSARVPQLLNCAETTRADVTDATLSDPDTATWRTAEARLIKAACKENADAS
ncbi:MAG: hypothetical protein AAGK37_03840 [Pseudomonadota bacterium]